MQGGYRILWAQMIESTIMRDQQTLMSSGGGVRRRKPRKAAAAGSAKKRGGAGESGDAKIWYDDNGTRKLYGKDYGFNAGVLKPLFYSSANLEQCNTEHAYKCYVDNDVFYHDGAYTKDAANQCRFTYAADSRIKRYGPNNDAVLAQCNQERKNDCFIGSDMETQTKLANDWNSAQMYAAGVGCIQSGGKGSRTKKKSGSAAKASPKWTSVKGKKALMKDGKKRSLYTCPSSKELRIRRMVLRNGEKKATYVKWLGQVVRC